MNRLDNHSKAGMWLGATLLLAFTAACGDSTSSADQNPTTPGTGTGTGVAGAHGPAPVTLGLAGTYAILAKSAISNVPTSAVTGMSGSVLPRLVSLPASPSPCRPVAPARPRPS